MPAYMDHCLDCGTEDPRVAGLDDHTALPPSELPRL
jgi:hypothetical protein